MSEEFLIAVANAELDPNTAHPWITGGKIPVADLDEAIRLTKERSDDFEEPIAIFTVEFNLFAGIAGGPVAKIHAIVYHGQVFKPEVEGV